MSPSSLDGLSLWVAPQLGCSVQTLLKKGQELRSDGCKCHDKTCIRKELTTTAFFVFWLDHLLLLALLKMNSLADFLKSSLWEVVLDIKLQDLDKCCGFGLVLHIYLQACFCLSAPHLPAACCSRCHCSDSHWRRSFPAGGRCCSDYCSHWTHCYESAG